MANTQMNVRIDEDVKARGDAVFSQLGLSATDVVRAVWGYAAEHSDIPSFVAAALRQPAGSPDALDREYRIATAEASHNLVADFRERFGLSAPDELEEIDYDELRVAAWRDRMTERGLA